MKKQLVSKTIRIIAIAVMSVLIISLALIWYRTGTSVETVEIEKEGLNYSWDEEVSWETDIIDNPMIDKRTLGKDDFIYKDLTETIHVTFNVPLVSETPMTFDGTTTFKASLMAVYGEKKEVLWEQVDIEDVSEVSINGDRLSFTVEEEIDVMPHKDFISQIEETYTLPGSYLYVFEYEIDGVIASDLGSHDFKIAPKAEFPIMSVVGKGAELVNDETEYKDIYIETIQQIGDRSMLPLVQVSIVVVLIVLVSFILFTENKADKDSFDRFCEGFLREHGDRMVAIPKSLSLQYGNVMTVEDPIDMIKAADEINQPVFYFYVNSEEQRKIEMFIFDDVRVYYYNKFGIMD